MFQDYWLNYLDLIKETLPPNIKILFFNKKPGTYVIRNTLALESKYDNLIFFDSDDIMKDNTVTDVLKNLNSHDSVRLMLMMFTGKVPNLFSLFFSSTHNQLNYFFHLTYKMAYPYGLRNMVLLHNDYFFYVLS